MNTPNRSVDLLHAACDDSSGTISVEGEVGPGHAAYLLPRRYRKQPDWWVIDVATLDAPTETPQRFRLSCEVSSMWGAEGIEVAAGDASIRIPRTADPTTDDGAEHEDETAASADSPSLGKLGGRKLRG